MQRLSSLLAGAAVSLALLAVSAPSQAAPFGLAPAVLTGDASGAEIQFVRNRHWRHGFHGGGLSFGFGLGFGGPFVGHPYDYDYYRPSYAYRSCPGGTFYEPGYGCVVDDSYGYGYNRYNRYDRYDYPAYYDRYPITRDGYYGGGGTPLDYRENQN